MKSIRTSDATRAEYHALFENQIRYGVILRGESSTGNLQRVLVLHKEAVRIMFGLKPLREAFKTLRILTVLSIYKIEVILYASKRSLLDETLHKIRRAKDLSPILAGNLWSSPNILG